MAINVTHYIAMGQYIYSIEWGQLNSVIHIMMSTAYVSEKTSRTCSQISDTIVHFKKSRKLEAVSVGIWDRILPSG